MAFLGFALTLARYKIWSFWPPTNVDLGRHGDRGRTNYSIVIEAYRPISPRAARTDCSRWKFNVIIVIVGLPYRGRNDRQP